jgi:formamidopyrimidine-DNA glycosylase
VELPEVEVMRRDLEKDVVGKRIKEVDVRQGPNALRIIRRHNKAGTKSVRKEFASRLAGRRITKVERKGKYILMHLEGGDVLVVHFGMSGQFLRATKRQPPPPHTHVVLTFQQGGDLRFVDPRTFGEMFVTAADDLGKVKELGHIAIDPLEDTFTWGAFGEFLFQRAAKMKQLLMDQKVISGLGNIYSDEVLFAAGLRHDRMSNTLSSGEVRRLYRAIQEIVQDAIRYRGTTLADEAYVDLFGKPGEYQNELKVYGRKGLPCRRCRTPIESVTLGGRRSFYCPQCQS